MNRLTFNEWTALESAGVSLFFLILASRELWPALKRGIALAGILGLACVGIGTCLGLAVNQRLLEKSSVVIAPEAVVRRIPLPEAQSAFTIHDGAELRVLGSHGDWLQVSDAANHIGWLPQREAALVP